MAEEPQEQTQEQQPQKKKPLWGFIASDPELTFTSRGDARFYARIGEPKSQPEPDGTFTDLPPQFGDLVMFRKSAERAFAKFQKGDNFIAVVEPRDYVNSEGVKKQQFVASRIGHDNNTTDYTVERRRPERDAAQRDTATRDQVQQALAEREAQLDPEAPATAGADPEQREAVTR